MYRFTNKFSSSITSSLNKIFIDPDAVENYIRITDNQDYLNHPSESLQNSSVNQSIKLNDEMNNNYSFLRMKQSKDKIHKKESDISDNESYLKLFKYKYLSEPDELINIDLFSANWK